MTTSRRSSVGARHCSTYPVVAQSDNQGDGLPMAVGKDPTNRSPRGQRPRSRTKLVLVAVSSINTNLAGSSRPCLRIQRRRARATSARSCSLARRLFFDGDIMSLEKSPDRGATAWNSLLAHRRNNLIQGLQPPHRRTGARLKLSAASRRDAPATTASITRSRKSSE